MSLQDVVQHLENELQITSMGVFSEQKISAAIKLAFEAGIADVPEAAMRAMALLLDEQEQEQRKDEEAASLRVLEAEKRNAQESVEGQEEWTCTLCCQSIAELQAAEQRIVWLEACGHFACVECTTEWIKIADKQGREPYCLTCGSGPDGKSSDRPLDDASIRQILGADAHALRSQRLLSRAGDLWPCPTPDCASMFELDAGEAKTKCELCGKIVTIGMPTLAVANTAAPSAPAVPAAASQESPPVSAHHPAAGSAARTPGSGQPAGSGSTANPPVLHDSESDEETLTQRSKRRKGEPAGAVSAAAMAAGAAPAAEAAVASSSSSSASSSSSVAAPDPHASVPDGGALGAVRTCPSCRNGVMKEDDEQCDKMQCRCGCKFCFHCGKRYTLSGGSWRAPCRCNIERYGAGHSFPRPPTP